jgi:hypothetical protein
MSLGLVGGKKRSPLEGAPMIMKPDDERESAIPGSLIGAKGLGGSPIRSLDPKRSPAAI